MTDESQGWSVYILRCADGTLYTGITTDIDRRIREHEGAGGDGKKGAKYVKGRAPVSLVFQFAVADRSVASKLEYRIKSLSRAEKQALIKGSIDLGQLLQVEDADGSKE